MCRHSALRRLTPLLALAVVLRVGWIAWALGAGIRPVSDAGWYYDRAIGIAAGAGYVVGDVTTIVGLAGGTPTAYWPVGYPWMLGTLFIVTGPSQLAGMIANIVMQCGAIVATYAMARSLFASERVAMIAALLMAIHPNQIAYSSLLLSEPLTLLLMTGGTALLLRARGRVGMLAAAGIVLGLGTLVKPQLIALPALCFLASRLGAGRGADRTFTLKGMIVCHLFLAATVAPWLVRNHLLFGEGLVLSTNDGMNLFIGNNPAANGTYTVNDSLERTIYGDRDPATMNEYQRNRAARSYAIDYIVTHPGRTLARIPAKLWYLQRGDGEGFSWNLRSISPLFIEEEAFLERMKIVAQLFYLPLLGAFIGWLVIRRRGERTTPYRDVGLWVMGYFTAIPIVYFGDGRFHAPTIPFMTIYAGAFIDAMLARRASGRPTGESERPDEWRQH